MGKVFCSVCNKRCKGDTLKIEEKFVHHKCFHCTKCKKNLQKGGFFVREQRFYCPDDYQNSFGVTCEACHAYVEGEAVTVLGKTFHTHCFRCSTCGRLFSSGERTTIIDGTYYCVSCATQISNGLPSSHPTSELESVTPSLSSPSKSKTYPERGRKDTISSTVSWSQKTLPSGLRPGAPPDASQVDEPVDSSLTNGVVKEYPLVSDQLTVQIHENGYLNAVPDLGKQKTATPSNTFGPAGDRGTMDTMFSTPGQTFSGESFTYSGSERRTCPPGVDYGRHYPISYLHLAEQGLTAIMSSDEFAPSSTDHKTRVRSRSLARLGYSSSAFHSQRQSRRDTAPPSTGTLPPGSTAVNGRSLDVTDQDQSRANTLATSPINLDGLIPPVCVQNRPRRDIYVRRRELSPGSASLGSGVVGYHAKPSRTSPFALPSDTHPYRSTPNVHAKRGMVALAESLVRPRPRPDRSLSPDSAAEYWAEARRLACYPNARLPDSTSLPAIERYDFPAPPSPAVVMIDKRREKRLTAQRKKAADTLDSTVPNGGTMTSELTDTELSDLPANITAKLHQIDSEIETLKRLGESSGITAALIQELQASKLVHARGPDLDPVSASRSPSANTEPGYKTRYERHVFASPSRDTRRDRRTAHELSYRMDYSSTGGRSGTIPSCASIPRPGYTSGALYSRAVSLPRPVAVGAGGDTGQSNHLASTPRMPLSSAGPRVTGPGHLRAGVGLRPGERLLYSGGMLDSVSGDRTLNTDESLLTTLAGAESQQLTHDGIASLATSALSVDGLTVCSGDDTGTLGPSGGTYCIKSGTMTGLPPSVTGLRPISSMLKQRSLTTRHRSRTQTPVRHAGAYGVSDSEILDVDSYPSVQSWLRPSSQKKMSFKTYPYEQLRSSATQPIKGLDRTRLENYLSLDEFESLFRMPLSAFQRLPEWKRFDLKKRLELL